MSKIGLDYLKIWALVMGSAAVLPASVLAASLQDLASRLTTTRQVLWVMASDPAHATVARYARSADGWSRVGDEYSATIGYKGFAPAGAKTEGDKKTPTGIYGIGYPFGYAPSLDTRLPYRQATTDDKIIDDPASPQYNIWVRGPTAAKSFERMRRDDGMYEIGLVLRYNIDPVVPGRGSAIFFHVWREPSGTTTGCVSLARQDLAEILRWLDPGQNPRVVLNPAGIDRFGPEYDDLSRIPGIQVSLRYATTNNFMHQDLYGDFQTAYLHKDAARKLRSAAEALQKEHPGWTLLIFDALRPRSVQRRLWDKVKGTDLEQYVADPASGSMHNYGMAVDLSLRDETGRELDMGTPFDDFRDVAQPQYERRFLASGELTAEQLAHRQILRKLMEGAGFIQLPNEWWHYDALPKDMVRSKYPIVD